MSLPDFSIIEASPEWAKKYRSFCQKTFSEVYYRPDLGITKELMSPAVFNATDWVEHAKAMCRNDQDHKLWLAVDSDKAILATIAVDRYSSYCEMKSFYVRPDLMHQGIGRQLHTVFLDFCGSLPIQLDVAQYMQDSIDTYKHWGYEIDCSKGKLTYPWQDWPKQALINGQGIYMVKPGNKSS